MTWLHARCQCQPYRELYEKAVSRYIASEGKELLLIGVLIRDTSTSKRDLKTPGNKLAKQFSDPTRIKLIAWYLPIPIADWPSLFEEMTP